MGRHEKWTLATSIIALAASLVALTFSYFQTQATLRQATSAEESLREARRLFDAAGPSLQLSTQVRFHRPDGITQPTSEADRPVIDRAAVEGNINVYLSVLLQNTGREATTIMDVAYEFGPTYDLNASLVPPESMPGGETFCAIAPGKGASPCVEALPYVLEPGGIYSVEVSLKSWYDFAASTGYCRDGVPITVTAVGVADGKMKYRSGVSVV